MKVYAHYESAASSRQDPNATQVFQITDAGKTVGSLIEDFVRIYNEKHKNNSEVEGLDKYSLCARTDGQVVVPADAPIAKTFKNGDDIWIVTLEEAMKENNERIVVNSSEVKNAIELSKVKAKDKSYYYWSRKATDEAPAPVEAPKQIRTRAAKQEEIIHYKTISSYSFEDEDGWVKVYISMPKVGDLPESSVTADFDVRSCSIRIMNYNGFNHRLQVPKLSEEIIPEESNVRVKKDTVIVRLRKSKKDHHWYELHKTKGIGEE
mmetsp:Transcript_9532/g.31900  ORF Transcript_9532/g.31900 Transcript_9532/m.31900 type:complete len:264 (-) Transcript_9532:1702-2493(-)